MVPSLCCDSAAGEASDVGVLGTGDHQRVITLQEYEAIIADSTKRIEGDLDWRDMEDRQPACTFRTPVLSDEEHPLEIVGRWNPMAAKLSYVLLYRGAGRIYALDLGSAHRNPNGERVGETHKHRWTAEFRDKQAYVPKDITATWDRPREVWQQFCAEARIDHRGTLGEPSVQQHLPQ